MQIAFVGLKNNLRIKSPFVPFHSWMSFYRSSEHFLMTSKLASPLQLHLTNWAWLFVCCVLICVELCFTNVNWRIKKSIIIWSVTSPWTLMSVCRSVCHNFLKRWEITFPCSYRSTIIFFGGRRIAAVFGDIKQLYIIEKRQ